MTDDESVSEQMAAMTASINALTGQVDVAAGMRDEQKFVTRIWKGLIVLIVVLGSVGFYTLEHQAHQHCVERRDDRTVVRELVMLTGTSGSPNFAAVPGFDQLDAPTQTYLRDLATALQQVSPGDEQSFRSRALVLLPPIDC